MSTIFTNPEVLHSAMPDLIGGIPRDLWNGSDPSTRQRLLVEYQRQRAQRHGEDEAGRANAIAHILARTKKKREDSTHGGLVRLQSLLMEAAAVAGAMAKTLPTAKHPIGEVMPQTQEMQS
ncbi:hypothetical protein [Lysobacter sp. GCM10012299]|uniref:hypothetical protein n=1 Tax=Lysobacter sp. GCM10012299 TaxID=3317333 RepID=UPI003610F376